MPRSELYKSTLWLQPVQARILGGGGDSPIDSEMWGIAYSLRLFEQ